MGRVVPEPPGGRVPGRKITPLQKITPGKLENWIATMSRRGGKNGRPLKSWTIKAAATPFRNLLDHAKREGIITSNPMRSVNPRRDAAR